jgi:site-specific recombinase XerD
MAAILNALRTFLRFCREVLRLTTLDPRQLRVPRIPRRRVVYLTKEEVNQFLTTIVRPEEAWEEIPLVRLRFRVLVEVLLGTGARISEMLALDRRDLDVHRWDAKILGKGKKERVLFFTERAIEWLARYLGRRRDEEEALFVTREHRPRRLSYDAVKTDFSRFAKLAHLRKKVTPIRHIKELLRYKRLRTTCRYYLGVDVRVAKKAHQNFLKCE